MTHALSAHRVAPLPRGMLSASVRNNADPKQLLNDLKAAHEGFKTSYDEKHRALATNVQAAIDDLSGRIAAAGLGSASNPGIPDDPEYSRIFASFFRHGHSEKELQTANAEGKRQLIQNALSTSPDQNGGYLTPTEWDRKIWQALRALSPMRRIANVIPTTVNAYSTVWSDNGWGSGWVGEVAGRPATTTPGLASVVFASGEIYANPAITQRLLDDADFNIEAWLADQVAETFQFQEGPAFVSGDGVNKPFGFLSYQTGGAADGRHPGGNLVNAPSGSATSVTPDGLVDFVYGLPSPYRQNAHWVMNSLTAAAIAKMKDGQGNYLWRETYVAGQPATLLGFPVEVDENMPAIAAGSTPIAFGDFKRGYVINDRSGNRALRDPYTNKPFVNFYTTKRVGGGVSDPRAIRLMKIAAS